ncbi:MAG: nucleotide sugar dehydrogenase [Gammaproteobacteria bacterium]|nr:MAG: nucleotide sugar dehydrogenase [Gammaproteobacteria bacterium]
MTRIAVIGLGYVGLPLAIELGKHYTTIGYDTNSTKLEAYREGYDATGEVRPDAFKAANLLSFARGPEELNEADYYIIAVPTPIDQSHRPNFEPLKAASKIVGKHMQRGSTIIYESTVFPGATEEICIPELEKYSSLKWKKDFNIGYSPERINPGDKENTLTSIVKVVSGDTPETLENVASLYETIIKAGVYRASSIKTAEAVKVIENTQRDLNIALMNELAIIFNKVGVNTAEVLEAAGTKWNFLPFKPGLVGGHCIGVDPYYLTYKADLIGYHPDVILAGRQINDGMGKYIAEQTIRQLIQSGFQVKGASINILGLTFKENCADLRNSRVIDIINELNSYGVELHIHDPLASTTEAKNEYGIDLKAWDQLPRADSMVIAVAHLEFVDKDMKTYSDKLNDQACIIDVKSILDANAYQSKGRSIWQL